MFKPSMNILIIRKFLEKKGLEKEIFTNDRLRCIKVGTGSLSTDFGILPPFDLAENIPTSST